MEGLPPPEWLGWLNGNVINPLYDILINPLRDNVIYPLLNWLLILFSF
jgi:hypothetical protein